jgi:hypothetical protein
MRRPLAVFLAGLFAILAVFALSLLMASGASAASVAVSEGQRTAGPVFGSGRLPGDAVLGAPAHNEPGSILAVPPAQIILTCTTTITTPNSDVTNNFNIPSAAGVFLLPYNNLSLMTPGVPPGISVTVQTQYFRLDAVGGQHYLVSAQPNTGSSYNLNINVYDAGGTRVFTGTKPLSSLGISIDYVPQQTATYYFAIFHQGSNCPPSGTYRLTVDGPATNTPTATGSPSPTGSATTAATAIPGADRYEPNFDFDRSTLIALNLKYTNLNFAPWSGSDPNSPDNDFYRVWVKPGLLVTCETLDLGPGVDTNMILYDNNRNGIGGSVDVDRAEGNFGSRLSYYVTYEGWLYILVGNEYPIDPPTLAVNYTYSVQCVTGFPTSTPTRTPAPVTPSPVIPTNTPSPSPVPTLAPTETPTPLSFRVIQLPTATPLGQRTVLVPLSLTVYYDLNNNGNPDPGEGVVGISARVIDVTTGQELLRGFTDEFGFASLTVQASGVVRLVVPYLNYSVIVPTSGSSVVLRIAPHNLPGAIP